MGVVVKIVEYLRIRECCARFFPYLGMSDQVSTMQGDSKDYSASSHEHSPLVEMKGDSPPSSSSSSSLSTRSVGFGDV
jgi:hypothetical protein